VLGFPCDQFGHQEPGNEAEIAQFCSTTYGVSFPMFAKVEVNGENACDLYKHLTSKEAYAADPGNVKWNFEKFLVNRTGEVVARFAPTVEPDSAEVLDAIEAALAEFDVPKNASADSIA
jgi:glutathione peroxidase